MSKIQYTIRGIPPTVDQIIRKRAKREGRSFNETVVRILSTETIGDRDNEVTGANIFDRLKGANTLDNTFDESIQDQSKIDESLWH